jgi:hypothetical protein
VAGQEHRERGRLRLDQDDAAAVGGRHGPGQRQPQPGALGAAADAPLEDARHQIGRDALALVPDLDHHRPRALPGLDRHRPTAMHERIVHQRGQHLGQPAGRHVRLQAAHADDLQLAPGPAEGGVPLADLLLHDLVDAGQLGGGSPAGRAQQLAHHVREAFGLGQGRAALLPDHVGFVRGGDHLLQPHGQRGQRGAQLVRGIHGELAIRREQAGQPPGEAVQPVGQLIQIGHAVPAAERARVPGAEPPGGFGEFLDRPRHPAREYRRQPRGQGHGPGHQPGDHGHRGRAAAGGDHQRGHPDHRRRGRGGGEDREPQPPAHRSARGDHGDHGDHGDRGELLPCSRRRVSRRVQSGTRRRGPW